MIKESRRFISRNLVNLAGWSTSRKIVVIESDDWGSIRMPSKEVYQNFLDAGIAVDKSPYCKYDSLATTEDLEKLFTVLRTVKDSRNNHPVITANVVTANPDFDKISHSKFQNYYYEKFTDTLKRYPACQNSFELWQEGINEKLFSPQFHGREHLNVLHWLSLLQNNHQILRRAFSNNFWGLSNRILGNQEFSIQAAYDDSTENAFYFQEQSIKEGLDIFYEVFGYKATSFIASNYIWSSALEKILADFGVNYIQGMKYQIIPKAHRENRKMIRHYLGSKNEHNQVYLIRNCVFEPSLKSPSYPNVGECLKDISTAFFWNKPAIITSHRLNFIGSLDPKNSTQNLKEFASLLEKIVAQWPEVEFLTSHELGNLIMRDRVT